MLFNSGTTSLWSYSQALAGSPSTAQSPLFGDQEVKDAINDAYSTFMEFGRQTGTGYGTKRSYATTVVDQLFYELPDDFIKMVLVEVETGGRDLSTTSPENADVETPRHEPNLDVLEMRQRGMLSVAQYYFFHGGVTEGTRHFGIADPVETAGTNALRITYEASSEDMSADGDEPMLPRNYHRAVCRRAAYLLRAQNDLPVRELKENVMMELRMFRRATSQVGTNVDWQIPLAGRSDRNYATQTGFVRKL